MVEIIQVHAGLRLGKLKLVQRVLPSDPRVHEAHTPYSYIQHGSLWECACDCGNTCFISQFNLERRRIKSCSCLRRLKFENAAKRRAITDQLKVLKAKIQENYQLFRQAAKALNRAEETRLLDLGKKLHEEKKALAAQIR